MSNASRSNATQLGFLWTRKLGVAVFQPHLFPGFCLVPAPGWVGCATTGFVRRMRRGCHRGDTVRAHRPQVSFLWRNVRVLTRAHACGVSSPLTPEYRNSALRSGLRSWVAVIVFGKSRGEVVMVIKARSRESYRPSLQKRSEVGACTSLPPNALPCGSITLRWRSLGFAGR